jgi:formate/nitrite transporter
MARRKRILVVDDEQVVRDSCRAVLEGEGFEVETAAGGRAGLDRFTQRDFDLALLDIKMPDMDGMDLFRRVHRDHPETAVIIITGYGTLEQAAEATRLGACNFLRKPFAPEELTGAVDEAFQRREAEAELAKDRHLSAALDRVQEAILTSADKAPPAVAESIASTVGVKKAVAPIYYLTVLGIMAGVYIAFGAALATMTTYDAARYVGGGVGRLLSGAVFSVGLMLVVIAGAELFTGNNLIVLSALEGRTRWGKVLRNWVVVWLANFAGSLFLVLIMYGSNLWKADSMAVGARAIAIANAKVGLGFGEAFCRAIGCNWLVCLAVWMALSARDTAGKVLAIFFPIMAFVAMGFEHCVANMYFIPMGLALKGTGAAAGMDLSRLTVGRMLYRNLLPVTLGNMVGGVVFVGILYWSVYIRRVRAAAGRSA